MFLRVCDDRKKKNTLIASVYRKRTFLLFENNTIKPELLIRLTHQNLK
jgi:hypothetical protein